MWNWLRNIFKRGNDGAGHSVPSGSVQPDQYTVATEPAVPEERDETATSEPITQPYTESTESQADKLTESQADMTPHGGLTEQVTDVSDDSHAEGEGSRNEEGPAEQSINTISEPSIEQNSAQNAQAEMPNESTSSSNAEALSTLNELMGIEPDIPRNRHGKIYAVVNQKGGVGKSTTAVNLSAALAEAGKTVLMVDIDPQGNASSGLGHNRGNGQLTEPADHGYCIYDVIINSVPVAEVVRPTLQKNLYLLPATIDLAGAEIELVPMMARETRLKSAIDQIRNYFDLIVIDCPPSIGLLTVNALAAADELIIPIQCEYFALEGLSRLVSSIDLVKNSLNPNLTIGGVLMTMQDNRLKLSSEVIDEVRNHFKDKVFNAVIPRNVRLSEAPSHGQPINVYDGASIGAKAYKQLAQEVISRG